MYMLMYGFASLCSTRVTRVYFKIDRTESNIFLRNNFVDVLYTRERRKKVLFIETLNWLLSTVEIKILKLVPTDEISQ